MRSRKEKVDRGESALIRTLMMFMDKITSDSWGSVVSDCDPWSSTTAQLLFYLGIHLLIFISKVAKWDYESFKDSTLSHDHGVQRNNVDFELSCLPSLGCPDSFTSLLGRATHIATSKFLSVLCKLLQRLFPEKALTRRRKKSL